MQTIAHLHNTPKHGGMFSSVTEPSEMTIQVEMRYVYGLQTFYPICEKAKIFARIAGTTTLTKPCRDAIKKLGYTINLITPEVEA